MGAVDQKSNPKSHKAGCYSAQIQGSHRPLLEIICGCCGRIFCICRRCYRGQQYCGIECRIAALLQSRRDAQKRYRQTDNGKEKHRNSERKRRMKEKKPYNWSKIILKTCACLAMLIRSLFLYGRENERTEHCSICGIKGRRVDVFPPRGYGKTISSAVGNADSS